MRILALDSSGLVASVAVVEDGAVDDQVIAEYTVNYKKTHSQTLLPMLDEIVKMTELDLHTVDAIAVAGGPGSFTGLRIGSATAKGLGLALEKPLIHILTLEGLAYNLCGIADVVCPIMDARRGQVYAGIYEFDGQKLHILEDQMAVPIEELGEKIFKRRKKSNLPWRRGSCAQDKDQRRDPAGRSCYICAGKYEPAESCIRRNTGNAVL